MPRWISQLGCIKGCLDYLGLAVSDAWLYGSTGQAFVLNVHEVVCPSGPTAWNTERVLRLAGNVGGRIDGVFGSRGCGNLARKRREAWQYAKSALDQGLPCYAWELQVPEYYVVNGYDEVAYHFSGPGQDAETGPKPWTSLGDTGIGIVEMYSVEAIEPAPRARAVREALAFALEHATNPEKWIFPHYRSGLDGYEMWIRALESATADGMGVAYNAAAWCECRGYAVLFLEEAREFLDGQVAHLLEQVTGSYRAVHDNLKQVVECFPVHDGQPDRVRDSSRVRTTLDALRRARDAEAAGLQGLEAIVDTL